MTPKQVQPQGAPPAADDAAAPLRGRPRSERARTAIIAAAAELLLELGLQDMSMDAVAERAVVSKATIYRWWSSKELLALDALLEQWIEVAVEPGGPRTRSLRGDLFGRVEVWARFPQEQLGRALGGLIARARSDPAFGRVYVERFVTPRRDAVRPLFARAIDRGEIPPDTDVEAAIDQIYGAIYHRMLQGHLPVDTPFLRTIVDTLVDGLHARRARG